MIWENNDDIRVEYCDENRRDIQRALDACRDERRPYLIIKNSELRIKNNASESAASSANSKFKIQNSGLSSILLPITMLEEEVYKAEICTYLARKTGAHLILLRANDYGSKAKQNTQRIITHIQTISQRIDTPISYEERVANGDSFHIHNELSQISATLQEASQGIVLILLTASREYGLDDWIFGPPELHVIRKAQVPVMLVNPRADLFSLCD